jgi:hypothetical protein
LFLPIYFAHLITVVCKTWPICRFNKIAFTVCFQLPYQPVTRSVSMSSINGIAGNGINVGQTNPYASVNQNSGVIDRDGDNDGSQASRGTSRGGAFAAAIIQALSQIGVSSFKPVTSASQSGSTFNATQDSHQALGAFLHDLFAALHAQAPAGKGTDDDGDDDGSGASDAAAASNGYQHHGGGTGGIAAKLQTLIQQLSSTDTSAGNAEADSPTSALQQDFSNLLTALGGSGKQTSLTDFLKAIADNLQGSNPGLNVSSKA